MKPTLTIHGAIATGPELTYTAKGTAMCRFAVASPGAKEAPPDVYPVTAWRGLAESVPPLVGMDVMVAVRIDTREYNGRRYLELVADGIYLSSGYLSDVETQQAEQPAPARQEPPPSRQAPAPKPTQPKLPTARPASAPVREPVAEETGDIPF